MIKLLAYTDGKPEAVRALHFAAELKKRLRAELAIITIRTDTHGSEEPPPIGIPLTAAQRADLPPGLRILLDAAAALVEAQILAPPDPLVIRDNPRGHMFVCKDTANERIPFYESFGDFVEILNREVDEHGYHLLIVAPHHRSKLGRMVVGSTTRELALDLHTSVLVVRGGGPDSRYLVCTDGSPSARRQFPLLRQLLPSIVPPIDLLCLHKADDDAEARREYQTCLQRAREWLTRCGKVATVHFREGSRHTDMILESAGSEAVITMGASLRHDVYRRMRGSLPMQVLERTSSSLLLVKLPPEADTDFMTDPFTCE